MNAPGTDPYREDLVVRLATADLAWGHEVGDAPHERNYIEWLADKVCGLQPSFTSSDAWAVLCADGLIIPHPSEQDARDFAAMIDPDGVATEVVRRIVIRSEWVPAETVEDAVRKAA